MAPIPKSAWLKLPAAQRGKLSYKEYANWVTKTVANRAAARAAAPPGAPVYPDPPPAYTFQPYKPVSHAGDQFPGFMPTPEAALRAQAQGFVNATVNPLLANLRSTYDARAAAGSKSIQGYTDQLAASMEPMAAEMGGFSDQAIGQTKAIDQGLADFIRAQGQKTVSGSPGSAPLAPDQAASVGSLTAALGAGAQVDNAARTSAALQQQVAEKAANQEYAATQPANARRIGGEQLASFQTGIGQQESEALGNVTAQVPGMVSSMFQNLLDRELTKAGTRQDLIQNADARDLNTYQANQTGRQAAATSAATRYGEVAGAIGDQADRDLTRWTAQQTLNQIDPTVSGALAGGIARGATGQPIKDPKTGKPYKLAPAPADVADQIKKEGHGGLDVGATQLAGVWMGKDGLPFRDPKGNVIPYKGEGPGGRAVSPGVSRIMGYVSDKNGTPIKDSKGHIIPVEKTGSGGATSQQRLSTKRVDALDKTAEANVRKMMKGRATTDYLGKTTYRPIDNANAYLSVVTYYRNAFPNMPESWILMKARSALVAGGYVKADRDPRLEAGWDPRRPTGSAGGGGGATAPGGVTGPVGTGGGGTTTTLPPKTAPGETRTEHSGTPQKPAAPSQTDKEKAQTEASAASHIADYATRSQVYMGPGKSRSMTPHEAFEAVMKALQARGYKHLSLERLRAIAHSAVGRMGP